MDSLAPSVCIDPNLSSLDLPNADQIFDMVYLDQPETLAPTNLTAPSATIPAPVPNNVRLDPSDGAWSAGDQEENVRRLLQTSTLGEFPFPLLPDPATTSNKPEKRSAPNSQADTAPPVPKRRRRRKAPLSEAQKAEKQRRFLERNRLAASKCRAKRKSQIELLGDSKKTLEVENEVLKGTIRQLWTELQVCREAVLAHAACDHADLKEWSERNADGAAVVDEFCQSLMVEDNNKGDVDDGEFWDDSGALDGIEGANGVLSLEDEEFLVNFGALKEVEAGDSCESLSNREARTTGERVESRKSLGGGEESRKSSIKSSPYTPVFSDDGGEPGRSSTSVTPCTPPTPAIPK